MQSEDSKDLKQSAPISHNPLRSQLNCARTTAHGFQSSKQCEVLIERLQQKDPDVFFFMMIQWTTSLCIRCSIWWASRVPHLLPCT